MPLQLAEPNKGYRNLGCMFWMEDLERAGKTYGQLLGWLEDMHYPMVVSPVHDRDVYTAEDVEGWCKRHIDADTGQVAEEYANQTPKVGDKKKPHVHAYFKLKGPKHPKELSKELDDFIPGIVKPNRWVIVPDFDAMLRYCAHMDQPKKAQYDPLAIHGFANVNMNALMQVKHGNNLYTLCEINRAIEKEKIPNFYRLNRWAIESGCTDYITYVSGRASYFNAIFAAMRQESIDDAERKKAMKAKMSEEMRLAKVKDSLTVTPEIS